MQIPEDARGGSLTARSREKFSCDFALTEFRGDYIVNKNTNDVSWESCGIFPALRHSGQINKIIFIYRRLRNRSWFDDWWRIGFCTVHGCNDSTQKVQVSSIEPSDQIATNVVAVLDNRDNRKRMYRRRVKWNVSEIARTLSKTLGVCLALERCALVSKLLVKRIIASSRWWSWVKPKTADIRGGKWEKLGTRAIGTIHPRDVTFSYIR